LKDKIISKDGNPNTKFEEHKFAKNINELGILKGFSCDNLEIISERNSGLFKLSTFSI
jgi:hypothetical protein